jgi:homoserine kinase
MKRNSISVFAPATVANVACGFDVLGFALHQPGDIVTLNLNKSQSISIKTITGDNGALPLDVKKNTAGVAIAAYLHYIGSKQGVEIAIEKKIPLGSGLGSSASSSAAAVVGINELMGKPLTRKELIPFAMEAERVACGAAHADNVAPAILGGFVLIRSYTPLDIVNIPSPKRLYCSVVHPHIELLTEDARKVLKKEIKLPAAIAQWGNLAALIAGLIRSDYDLIGRSLHDVVAEPVRSVLIPGFEHIKQAALDAGSLGCSISGSGPSVFALCKDKITAQRAAAAMQKGFAQYHLTSQVYVGKVNNEGAMIL